MTLNDFCERLAGAAKKHNWMTYEMSEFEQKRFRGREDDAEVTLPGLVKGLRLGDYPVLVLGLDLVSQVSEQVRAVHNQMLIARSYMSKSEVINAHAFFVCTTATNNEALALIDKIERDEQVCRKLVWNQGLLGKTSFEDFVERTFLAQPWHLANEVDDAPLDQNVDLVSTVLQDEGLSASAAQKWIELAESNIADPQDLIDMLITAMDQ